MTAPDHLDVDLIEHVARELHKDTYYRKSMGPTEEQRLAVWGDNEMSAAYRHMARVAIEAIRGARPVRTVTLPNGDTINVRDVRLVEKLISGPGGAMFYITVADLEDRIFVGNRSWVEGKGVTDGKYVPNGMDTEHITTAHAALLKAWNEI